MLDEIPLVPTIPEGLREAAQIGKLVPFVGAGASCLGGCPGWPQFAADCLKTFVDKNKFNHAQMDQIVLLNPRVRLSIALALQEQHQIQIDFRQILHRKPKTAYPEGQRLYSSLARLGNTFVTTNYDEWLDEVVLAPTATVAEPAGVNTMPQPRSVYYKTADLTADHLSQGNTVLHLHGSVKDPSGMVVTTPQYIQHYANDRRDKENPVLTFLTDLFRSKVVLFVGYGLAELEILEYVMVKTKGLAVKGEAPRHYLLEGFFSHERELMSSLKEYYRQCGVELLPFLKDQRSYEQLIDVLEVFASKIPASQPMVAQELLEMEGLLDG